jgi:hypothetical protein
MAIPNYKTRSGRASQLLAGALREAKKYASGGPLNARSLGRVEKPHFPSCWTDQLLGPRQNRQAINVKAGSYIIASDTVSARGEGNTAAGTKSSP